LPGCVEDADGQLRIVLSSVHAKPLLLARQQGLAHAVTSLDLGLTTCQVSLTPDGVVCPGGGGVSWDSLQAIAETPLTSFQIQDSEAIPIQSFSERLNRFYSLMPTGRAPTLLVSGIPMHRIQGADPYQDTLNKVRTISPFTGWVLDTCTGLGYTAIQAARVAERVTTIELDPAVLDIARLNPWSRQLFENPRVEQVVGDAGEEIYSFPDGVFARIVHDPPTFSLAGELYSGEFYRQLYRVLRRGGRLFHYIGDLESRSGHGVARGVVKRLQDAGFARIGRRPAAFGVVAYK
jgi:uncharacterized protein